MIKFLEGLTIAGPLLAENDQPVVSFAASDRAVGLGLPIGSDRFRGRPVHVLLEVFRSLNNVLRTPIVAIREFYTF